MERETNDSDRESAAIERLRNQEQTASGEVLGFAALSNDENERFIALCEAPALLWYTDSGALGPFGVRP